MPGTVHTEHILSSSQQFCTFHALQARETEAQSSQVAFPETHSCRTGLDPRLG